MAYIARRWAPRQASIFRLRFAAHYRGARGLGNAALRAARRVRATLRIVERGGRYSMAQQHGRAAPGCCWRLLCVRRQSGAARRA